MYLAQYLTIALPDGRFGVSFVFGTYPGKDADAAADVAAIDLSVMKDENNALSAYLLAVIDTPPAFLRSL